MDGIYTTIHLVIKYKKGIYNKVAHMLSRHPTNALIALQNCPLAHNSYIEQYTQDEEFKYVYESVMNGTQIE